eukprot:355205-Chlamydomonas_euryale.AAC.3
MSQDLLGVLEIGQTALDETNVDSSHGACMSMAWHASAVGWDLWTVEAFSFKATGSRGVLLRCA